MRWATTALVAIALSGTVVAQSFSKDIAPPTGIALPNAPSASSIPSVSTPAFQGLADAWNWVGNALKQVCSLTQGNPITVQFQGFSMQVPIALRPQPELDWVCEAGRTWAFFNGIISTDWNQFAGEMLGGWIGDLATGIVTDLGIQAGSAEWSSKISEFNDALKSGYKDFVKKLRNAVWTEVSAALQNERNARKTPTPISPENANNPVMQALAKAEDANKKVVPLGMLKAVTIEQNSDRGLAVAESQSKLKAIEDSKSKVEGLLFKPTAKRLSQYLGQGPNGVGTKGVLQETLDKAKQAPDTRTAVEVLTEMSGHLLSSQLYGDKTITDGIAIMIEQQYWTNKLLADMIRAQGYEAVDMEEAYKDQIDTLAAQGVVEKTTAETLHSGTMAIINSVISKETIAERQF